MKHALLVLSLVVVVAAAWLAWQVSARPSGGPDRSPVVAVDAHRIDVTTGAPIELGLPTSTVILATVPAVPPPMPGQRVAAPSLPAGAVR